MLCWILNLNASTVIQNYIEFNDETLVPYMVEYRMGIAWRSCWTFHWTGFSDYVFRTDVSRGGKATKNIFSTLTPSCQRIPPFDTKIDIKVCLKPGILLSLDVVSGLFWCLNLRASAQLQSLTWFYGFVLVVTINLKHQKLRNRYLKLALMAESNPHWSHFSF